MVAVAGFSLAIFDWALHVALPTERIEALVRRGASLDDEPAMASR